VGPRGVDWARTHFRDTPVIYVAGNHEYYLHALPELTESLKSETPGTRIQFLENKAVELAGFTFLGCTLWTDFALGGDAEAAMRKAEVLMNDYRLIRFSLESRVLEARDTARLHRESVAWLADELPRHNPARTIVVTHHAPSPRSEAPYHSRSPLRGAFSSDLGALMERSGVALWIHGHTHYNVDYRIGPTRVLTNQRGYPGEPCRGFDPAMVIDV